jgi:hypothetical protein
VPHDKSGRRRLVNRPSDLSLRRTLAAVQAAFWAERSVLAQDWKIANRWAIQRDDAGDVWHAGRCLDLLAIGQGSVLVATDTGGVWLIDGAYQAKPLSDSWDAPDMECIAPGPLGREHIVAGARGGLYETDITKTNSAGPKPNLVWRQVDMPPTVSTVHRTVASYEPRRLVIATDRGIWSAAADGSGSYRWELAHGIPDDDFFGLTHSSVGFVVGVGHAQFGAQGIYYGGWEGNDLVFQPASFGAPPPGPRRLPGIDPAAMQQVSVASCQSVLDRVYACAQGPEGEILYLLASYDGGIHWGKCKTVFANELTATGQLSGAGFLSLFGTAINGGDHKTISVHPVNPDVVAFAWRYAAISSNAGESWTAIGGYWTKHGWDLFPQSAGLHVDTHAVIFDSAHFPNKIYVLSDGGVAETDDWSQFQAGFRSVMNQTLANLQFLSPQTHRDPFWGTLGVSSFEPLLGGGLQDNGNVWCQLDSTVPAPAWKRSEGGDGGWVAFLDSRKEMVVHSSDQTDNDPTRSLRWDGLLSDFDDAGIVPLHAEIGHANPTGLRNAIAERVPRPNVGLGPVLYATAASAFPQPGPLHAADGTLWGLYRINQAPGLNWGRLAVLPAGTERVSAVGPDTYGAYSFAGTSDGRIFKIETESGLVTEQTVEVPKENRGAVSRIVSDGDGRAFAVVDSETELDQTGHRDLISFLLQLVGDDWKPLVSAPPLPAVTLYALDISRVRGDSTLAVASDTTVWLSPDLGRTWTERVNGLPRVPHCSDLRFSDDGLTLYLSTFGRSVWMADLRPS